MLIVIGCACLSSVKTQTAIWESVVCFLNVQGRKISEICLSHKTASFRTQFSSMEKVTQVNCTLSICLCSQISIHFRFLSSPMDLPSKERDIKMKNWLNSSVALGSLKIFRIKLYLPGELSSFKDRNGDTSRIDCVLLWTFPFFWLFTLCYCHQHTQLHTYIWS